MLLIASWRLAFVRMRVAANRRESITSAFRAYPPPRYVVCRRLLVFWDYLNLFMTAWGKGSTARSCDTLLARVEANDPTLKEVVILPIKSFGAAEVERIATALATGRNTHLESLSASGHALSPASLARLGSAIAQMKSGLVRLAVGDRTMGDEGLEAFCKELENVRGAKLEVLDFAWKDISERGLVALGQAFGKSNHLRELNLSRNERIDDNSLIASLEPLSMERDQPAFRNLEVLNFSECGFKANGLQAIVDCLSSGQDKEGVEHERTLKLVVSGNALGSRIAPALSTLIRGKLAMLNCLSMSGCNIEDVGLEDLCRAVFLGPCRKLRSLDLSSNDISDIGAASLARSLWVESESKWTELEELSLAKNPLTSEGVEALASSLSHRSSTGEIVDGNNILTRLDFSGTDCGISGAVALIRCTKLSSLRLFNNKLGSSGFEALAVELQGGHLSLVSLDLGGNDASEDAVVVLLEALASANDAFVSKLRILEIGGNGKGPRVEAAIKHLQSVHPGLDVARDRLKQHGQS